MLLWSPPIPHSFYTLHATQILLNFVLLLMSGSVVAIMYSSKGLSLKELSKAREDHAFSPPRMPKMSPTLSPISCTYGLLPRIRLKLPSQALQNWLDHNSIRIRDHIFVLFVIAYILLFPLSNCPWVNLILQSPLGRGLPCVMSSVKHEAHWWHSSVT